MKLTPWYLPDAKPVREGWYDCEFCHEKRHYWDGTQWRMSKDSVATSYNTFHWRGLAEPPKGEK